MYVALHEVKWCMVVWSTQNLRQDSCSFMWHQPCQHCKYTTLVDIQKTRYKAIHSCRTICERSESAKRVENSANKSDHQSNCDQCQSMVSALLYVQENHKARWDRQPRMATSTLTELLNYDQKGCPLVAYISSVSGTPGNTGV